MYSVFEVATLDRFKSEDILETFWNSGLHGGKWTNAVYAIATCKLNNIKCSYGSRNTPSGAHAETKMVRWLRERVQDGTLRYNQSVTMYVNYSPCHNCSRQIRSLVVEQLDACNVRLEVVVAWLYKIARPSCWFCTTHSMPDEHEHDRNVQGLRDLLRVGVVVRTFNSQGMQDWNRLATHALQVDGFGYRGSDRKIEDEKLEEDLKSVLMEDTLGRPVSTSSIRATFPTVPSTPGVRNHVVLPRPTSVSVLGPGNDIIRQQSCGLQSPAASDKLGKPDDTVIYMLDDIPEEKKSSWCRCSIL